MAFDCFTPFSMFRFSSAPSPAKQAYDALSESLGPGLQNPVQEAITYGLAMMLGAAQHQQDGAAAQADPLQCTALLPELESDYQIIPTYGETINERQQNLAAAMALEAGATETNIEAGLTPILGSAFSNWKGLDLEEEVIISAAGVDQSRWEIELPTRTADVFPGLTTGICYGEDVDTWVAVSQTGASSRVSISFDDGQTWGTLLSSPLKTWNSVCWGPTAGGNTYLVAVGETSGGDIQSVMTSASGTSWTLQDAVEGAFKKVVYTCANFIAVGTNVLMYAADPTGTWTSVTTGDVPSHDWVSIASGNGINVAVAADGYIITGQMDDPSTWGSAANVGGQWSDITYGNGVFVAVRQDGAYTALWSTDGVTWTATNVTSSTLYAVAFADGLFMIAATFSGQYQLWTSTDGKTWTSKQWLTLNNPTTAIATRANRFVGATFDGVSTWGSFRARLFPRPTAISPDSTPIKHVTLTGPTTTGGAILPGTVTCTYAAFLSDGNPLMTGEYITVEPGQIGLQERVMVTAINSTTITATFSKPHSAGVRATTAPWPTWRSTKRHSIVSVSDGSALSNRTTLARVNQFMRRVMPASCTWIIQGTGLTSITRVGGGVGSQTIGAVSTAD